MGFRRGNYIPFCSLLGQSDEYILVAELEREDGVPEVVPVNNYLAASYATDEPYNGQCGYARRVLTRVSELLQGVTIIYASYLHEYELWWVEYLEQQRIQNGSNLQADFERCGYDKWNFCEEGGWFGEVNEVDVGEALQRRYGL